ncbi:MAG: hypothetical protein VKQ33_01180 [Candidatus Sericytochromatia bacterium]|nr:hypothetical protein [Candidatus Sericytochromatia bacterium]
MRRARPRWLPATSVSLMLALAGCVVPPGASTGTAKSPLAAAARTPSASLKQKPRAGDAAALERLKASGRVQITFKGLGSGKAAEAARAARPGGGSLVSGNGGNVRAQPQLLQTTADLARVEITLTSATGASQTQALTREQLQTPWVTMFFDAVPAGEAALEARAYTLDGATIGNGVERFTVVRGQVTEVALNVKLAALGGVGATITFEDADIEEANITGHWVVGAGPNAPRYPMSGCGEGYVWFVNQYGNSLQASVQGYNDEASPDVRHRGLYWSEEAYGTIQRDRVRLTGRVVYTDEQGNMAAPVEEVVYQLTFDPDAWQLTGTRNGQPGWAVPYTFDADCGMPPPPFPLPMPVPTAPPASEPAPYPYEAPASARSTVMVQGRVWRRDGSLAREGHVWFHALDPASPWGADAPVQPDGSYEIQGVPTGTPINIYASGPGGSSDGYMQFFGYSDEPQTYDVELWDDCLAEVPDGGYAACAGSLPPPADGPYPEAAEPAPTIAPDQETPAPAWTPTVAPDQETPTPAWTPTAAPNATPAPGASSSPPPTPPPSNSQGSYRLRR